MQIKNKTVKNIIKGIENVKGENINIIDFTKLENVDFKYFIICDCQSNIQVKAISNSVKKIVSKELKEKPFNIEGLDTENWVLMDYIDVIVHIFKKEFREIYDLEKLWGDAEVINI